jgi:predicted nucleotidyltransferase
MVNQQTAIKSTETFAKELINLGIHLRKVILFGSYAKQTQREDSDIDVALVADEFSGVGFEDIMLILPVLRKYFVIQPQTYPTQYFEAGDPFISEIKKYGIEIKI